jgi:hypothetical protein
MQALSHTFFLKGFLENVLLLKGFSKESRVILSAAAVFAAQSKDPEFVGSGLSVHGHFQRRLYLWPRGLRLVPSHPALLPLHSK